MGRRLQLHYIPGRIKASTTTSGDEAAVIDISTPPRAEQRSRLPPGRSTLPRSHSRSPCRHTSASTLDEQAPSQACLEEEEAPEEEEGSSRPAPPSWAASRTTKSWTRRRTRRPPSSFLRLPCQIGRSPPRESSGPTFT